MAAVITSRTHTYPLIWAKVEQYCSLRGEHKSAVMTRRRRGIWLDGVHTKVKDGRLYVNLPEADRWIESGQ